MERNPLIEQVMKDGFRTIIEISRDTGLGWSSSHIIVCEEYEWEPSGALPTKVAPRAYVNLGTELSRGTSPEAMIEHATELIYVATVAARLQSQKRAIFREKWEGK